MCVCLYLVEGMLCAVCTVRVYRSHSTVLLTLTLSGRPSSPPDNTLYPAMLTVAASYSFLKRLLKLHSALLIITAALGSPIGTRTCPLSSEEEERRKAEKGGRAVQLSLRLAPCFFFFLFPFEVVRHSFKPHCTPMLCTRESVMNMYQHSIWQQ